MSLLYVDRVLLSINKTVVNFENTLTLKKSPQTCILIIFMQDKEIVMFFAKENVNKQIFYSNLLFQKTEFGIIIQHNT